MRFHLTEEQALFVQSLRRYLDEQLPLALIRARHDKGGSFDHPEWARRAELGLLSVLVPENLGGAAAVQESLSAVDAALVAEETGRALAPGPVVPGTVVAWTLGSVGVDGHPPAELPAILAGRTVATWAVDEFVRGATSTGIAVGAQRASDGWVLDGTTRLVQDVDAADVVLVAARTPEGPAEFMLPLPYPGATVQMRESLDLVRRFGDLSLNDVRVPASALVAPPGEATLELISTAVRLARVLHLAETVGALNRVLAMTLEYAMDRIAFGRPVASYQAIKHRFADLTVIVEAANAAADEAAAKALSGPEADEFVTAACVYVHEKGPLVVQACVQIHGGIGVTWDHDLHLFLRRVTQNATLYGTVPGHRRHLAEFLASTSQPAI